MKNIIKYIAILVFVIGLSTAFAQTAPPPNNGQTGNGGGTVVGGGAPIGGGLLILCALGLAYALAKHRFNKDADFGI
ncbi:MAG: hypothetical protein KAH25_11270 [Bacteroidales bacterium]|nr:hypothetical protein [Bacteroidales bacterium]